MISDKAYNYLLMLDKSVKKEDFKDLADEDIKKEHKLLKAKGISLTELPKRCIERRRLVVEMCSYVTRKDDWWIMNGFGTIPTSEKDSRHKF